MLGVLLSSTIYAKKIVLIVDKPYKRKVKMNLYLKFDAQEARSSKLGFSMVLDTKKCSKFDARTHSILEKKVLEFSLIKCPNFFII